MGLVNFLAFQIGWFSCILGAAWGWPMIGPLVVLGLVGFQLFLSKNPGSDALLLLSITLLGTIIDSLHAAFGVVFFENARPLSWICPMWMSALWMIFATTLRGALAWLDRRWKLAFMLGALAGPGSYYAGARLGAIGLNENLTYSLLVLAAVWGATLPVLFWLSRGLAPSPNP